MMKIPLNLEKRIIRNLVVYTIFKNSKNIIVSNSSPDSGWPILKISVQIKTIVYYIFGKGVGLKRKLLCEILKSKLFVITYPQSEMKRCFNQIGINFVKFF